MKTEPIIEKALYHNPKTIYQEYLKYFDAECKTDAEHLIKEIPLLTAIYEDFVPQLIRESKISKMASDLQAKLTDELNNVLTHDEQKKLLEWQELEHTIYDEREQQIFICGYAISTLLRYENQRLYRHIRHKSKKSRNARRNYNVK